MLAELLFLPTHLEPLPNATEEAEAGGQGEDAMDVEGDKQGKGRKRMRPTGSARGA